MNVLALPDDPKALKGVITENLQVIANLEERIRLFQAILFGPKSEKRKEPDPTAQQQHSLFDEPRPLLRFLPKLRASSRYRHMRARNAVGDLCQQTYRGSMSPTTYLRWRKSAPAVTL